jgi:hypothetical protein
MSTPAGYFDGSYPPSVFAPPTPKATGATAGIPGSWTPAGSTPPADLVALQGASPAIVASPASAWTSGQYVQTGTTGAAGRATWSGADWVGGAAPITQAAKRKATKPPEKHAEGDVAQ